MIMTKHGVICELLALPVYSVCTTKDMFCSTSLETLGLFVSAISKSSSSVCNDERRREELDNRPLGLLMGVK